MNFKQLEMLFEDIAETGSFSMGTSPIQLTASQRFASLENLWGSGYRQAPP